MVESYHGALDRIHANRLGSVDEIKDLRGAVKAMEDGIFQDFVNHPEHFSMKTIETIHKHIANANSLLA